MQPLHSKKLFEGYHGVGRKAGVPLFPGQRGVYEMAEDVTHSTHGHHKKHRRR